MDKKIFERFMGGDEGAFKTIFEEYSPCLIAFARRFVASGDVSDVLQDIFLQLWNHRADVQNPELLKSYLFAATRNHCLNILRARHQSERYLESLTEADFEDHILDVEVYTLLYKTIADLPERYRTAIELSMNGDTLEEIAQKMCVTIDAVKGYKKRGKAMLRKNLEYMYGTTVAAFVLARLLDL